MEAAGGVVVPAKLDVLDEGLVEGDRGILAVRSSLELEEARPTFEAKGDLISIRRAVAPPPFLRSTADDACEFLPEGLSGPTSAARRITGKLLRGLVNPVETLAKDSRARREAGEEGRNGESAESDAFEWWRCEGG